MGVQYFEDVYGGELENGEVAAWERVGDRHLHVADLASITLTSSDDA